MLRMTRRLGTPSNRSTPAVSRRSSTRITISASRNIVLPMSVTIEKISGLASAASIQSSVANIFQVQWCRCERSGVYR